MKISKRAARITGCRTGHIIAILISCLLAAMCFLWPEIAYADNLARTLYVSTQDDPLNVRAKPNLHAEIIARLERGEAVAVIEAERGWALVVGVGEMGRGYASMKYLSEDKPAEDAGPLVLTIEED